jgi:hypothetical protein
MPTRHHRGTALSDRNAADLQTGITNLNILSLNIPPVPRQAGLGPMYGFEFISLTAT